MSAPASTSSPRRSSRFTKGIPPSNAPTTKSSQPRLRVKKNEPQIVYLRVNRRFLGLLPAPTADQPNPAPFPPPPGASGNLVVIQAELPELHKFAGRTTDWLIRIARLIFEPLGTSSLYTFTTETVEWWMEREMEPTLWRPVMHGEQLRATIYEFRPDSGAFIVITKMSLRHARSVTTNISVPRATEFRHALIQRDTECIISQHPPENMLVASHLIPRRLGNVGVQSVLQRFTGPSIPVDRYDPTVGVLLVSNLDVLADGYDLGFWNNGTDHYVVHNFVNMALNYGGLPLSPNDQALHGRQIVLSTHDPSLLPLPPTGVFNWHYIQCVLKKFSTRAYQEIDNIYYFYLPFRTRDDDDESDIDFDDERNIANPPYPSYPWDLAVARAHQHSEAVERNRAIMTWNSHISIN